jgi:serine/threonine protein kinase
MLALNYMHKQGIAHRDLKPENLLCLSNEASDFRLKLTDFGFATLLNPDKKPDLSLGSPLYMAPELVREEEYDERVDVWALGCIAFILLSGKPPYFGRSKEEIYSKIANRSVVYDEKDWRHIS